MIKARFDDRVLVSDMYYDWLKEFVRTDNSEYYNELLGHLYYRTYIWMLPNDENRAADGLSLRNRFEYETGIRVGIGNCSVLEMLIALANRIENEIMGDPVREDNTWYWFWAFIDNLGLLQFINIVRRTISLRRQSFSLLILRNY